MERPDFSTLHSYEDFSKFYWYLEELKQICKSLKLNSSGGKIELQERIKKYFQGEKEEVKKSPKKKVVKSNLPYTLETRIIESGFTFGPKAKKFFIEQTGLNNFHFNADMVASVKKAKEIGDEDFCIKDLLDIFYGKKEYALYDKSVCQWNQFVKDFYADLETNEEAQIFLKNSGWNKQEAVRFLWKCVRDSDKEKVYNKEMINLLEKKND